MKAVRTDAEIECPGIDAGLRARGVDLVMLPEGLAGGGEAVSFPPRRTHCGHQATG